MLTKYDGTMDSPHLIPGELYCFDRYVEMNLITLKNPINEGDYLREENITPLWLLSLDYMPEYFMYIEEVTYNLSASFFNWPVKYYKFLCEDRIVYISKDEFDYQWRRKRIAKYNEK